MLVCVWVAAVSSLPVGVAARRRPRALRLGVAGEVARWFETAIAFAGGKWAFFGAFFGRRGVVGFSGPVLGVSSGVVGFIVAMFLCPVRDVCRPARPDVGASAKKFTLCRSWMQRGARGWLRWGFCSIRSWLSACRRRVGSLMTSFPRLVVVRLRRGSVCSPKCRPPR